MSTELITAAELEKRGILRRGTAYKMAKRQLLPFYKVGANQSGIRFRPEEVLASLRETSPIHSGR